MGAGRAVRTGMLRTALLCVVISPLVGCAADGVTDELAGESEADGEIGKGDGEEAFTYFQVSPDPRAEGGFLVSRPNRAATRCGGTGAASLPTCYAGSLDWSRSQLADTSSFETRLREGEPILVRGQLEESSAESRGARAESTLEGDAQPAIQAAQPMINKGAENGPDCLYAQLHVTSLKAATATITITEASAGQFAFQGRLERVTMASTSQYAVACVGGSNPIAARIATVDISGAFEVVDGAPRLVGTPVTTLAGVEVDDAGLPDTARQLLDLRGAGATSIIVKTAALVLGPIVARPPGLGLAVSEVWVPGFIAGDDEDVENVFVLAKTAPDGIRERRLNSNRSARIETIDFTVSNAAEASIEAARTALGSTGVIFAGSRFLDGEGNLGRTAERFWTRAQ